jgi:hypothetical protein
VDATGRRGRRVCGVRGGKTLFCSVVLCLEGGAAVARFAAGVFDVPQGKGNAPKQTPGGRGPVALAWRPGRSTAGIAARQLSRREPPQRGKPGAAAELREDNAPRVFGYTLAA